MQSLIAFCNGGVYSHEWMFIRKEYIMLYKRCIYLCVLCVFAGLGYAEDIRLAGGRVLKDAKVVSAGVDFVRISHEEGIAKVDAKDLPEALKREWQMEPDQIDRRRVDLKQKEEERREIASQRAKALRESLDAAQSIPRYIQPSELFNLLASLGGVDPVEAQYMALKWNEAEANRLGFPDQAQTFKSQLAVLEPKIQELVNERKEQVKIFEEMGQKVDQLAKMSNEQVQQLQNQIRSLQYDLNDAKSRPVNTVVIKQPYYSDYHYDRPIIRPVIRPVPVARQAYSKSRLIGAPPLEMMQLNSRPVPSRPAQSHSMRPQPTGSQPVPSQPVRPQSVKSQVVRPAVVR